MATNTRKDEELREAFRCIVSLAYARPSAVYRPALMQDGNAWLAIYGDLPTGVSGCGDSPESAMADFDKKWHEKAQGIDGKPDQLLVAFPGFGTALDSLNALSATPKPL